MAGFAYLSGAEVDVHSDLSHVFEPNGMPVRCPVDSMEELFQAVFITREQVQILRFQCPHCGTNVTNDGHWTIPYPTVEQYGSTS